MTTTAPATGRRARLWEVCLLFLKLGATGFGGPAVTIAMMEDEVVHRRQWLTRPYFLDIVGATNLIPGPNATEIAIQVGYIHAGWPGLVLAGLCFILPGALLTLALAWAYRLYGTLPAIMPFLGGIKPAVLAVIVGAVWRMGKGAIQSHTRARRWRLVAVGLGVTLASLLGVDEIPALFAGGFAGMLWLQANALRQLRPPGGTLLILPWLAAWTRALPPAVSAIAGSAPSGPSLWLLFLFFLQVGAVLFGSGYVLIAFLEGGLVDRFGWLTSQQLLDAIAAGQFTPGPLSQTATFVGYLVLGIPGAALATLGMFLPSFLISLALSAIVPHLRRSAWVAAFMDAVNVCALGLMAAVAAKLGAATLTTWSAVPTWAAVAIALLAALVALRFEVNSAWLVLGGALLGWIVSLVG